MATYVNLAQGWSNDSGTTRATASFNATAGNLLAVYVVNQGGDRTVTISDTASNSYTTARTNIQVGTFTHRAHAFYCLGASGNASNVVTATFNSAAEYAGVICLQYSGPGSFVNSYIDASTNNEGLETVGISASASGAGVLVSGAFLSQLGGTYPTNDGSTSNRRATQLFSSYNTVYAIDDILIASAGTYTTEYDEPAEWDEIGNIAMLFADGGSIVPQAMANYRMRTA